MNLANGVSNAKMDLSSLSMISMILGRNNKISLKCIMEKMESLLSKIKMAIRLPLRLMKMGNNSLSMLKVHFIYQQFKKN